MDEIKITIVTPNDPKICDTTNYVLTRTDDGEIGFLKDHTPLIGKISDGFIRYNETFVCIQNGVIDFNDNELVCICQDAEVGSSLEEAKNNLRLKKEKHLKEAKRKLVDFTEAEKDLAKSLKDAKLGRFVK